jgi:hypothetical protein
MAEREDNALTLEGLAQKLHTQTLRLETLERENAELRHKVATLESSSTHRDELAQNRGSDTPRDGEEVPASEELAGRLSRRALLSKAGAAAVAAAAAGTLLHPREAKANHIYGSNTRSPTVSANQVNTHTLVAENQGNIRTAAVSGRSTESQANGVWGRTGATDYAAVKGEHQGLQGNGVSGYGRGQSAAGVFGVNDDGYGVAGRSRGGIGGLFEGGLAQLALIPGDKAGKPNKNARKGSLYMDSQATLFVRTAEGNPGKWEKVSTTPV